MIVVGVLVLLIGDVVMFVSMNLVSRIVCSVYSECVCMLCFCMCIW